MTPPPKPCARCACAVGTHHVSGSTVPCFFGPHTCEEEGK